MKAEKVVHRYSKGIPRIDYIKIRPRNEALDLAILNLSAIAMLNVNTKRVQRCLEDVSKPEPEKPAVSSTGHEAETNMVSEV